MVKDVIREIRGFGGIKRKKELGLIKEIFKEVMPVFGDDGGIIEVEDGYLIFSTDSIIPSILTRTPYWGGYASVIVNVNDIYAMGGTPLGIVNVISARDKEMIRRIAEGIRDGAKKYRIPVLGGHLAEDHDPPSLAVAILGKGRKLLKGFGLRARDLLILAIDIKGKRYADYLHWNSVWGQSSEELLDKLEILNIIAENELATGAKDISMGGILGTVGIMLELSDKGAWIELDSIPYPEDFNLIDWLKVFPSYGFILGVARSDAYKVIGLFEEKGISASIIGEVDESKSLKLRYKGEEGILFDFCKERII